MSASTTTSVDRFGWGNIALCGLLAVLAACLLRMQAGEWEWHAPGITRWLAATAALLVWSGLTARVAWSRRSARSAQAHAPIPQPDDTLVVFASQTGTAEQLAQQTMQSLRQAGKRARLLELGALDDDMLQHARHMLFVVSTTGEGDAPDGAARFVTHRMREPMALAQLHYGLLSLGDSDYDDFCGFGRQLQHWLQRSGATPMFDAVEVDNGDAAALRHWQHHLALFTGVAELPDWQRPDYQRWQLVERRLLNPESLGGPCFHLALRPLQSQMTWQAGDLVEIGPRHADAEVDRWLAAEGLDGGSVVAHHDRRATLREWLAGSHLPPDAEISGQAPGTIVAGLQPLPHREYSIASLPSDGALHLLVRRMQRDDGAVGIGSGWLTQHAAVGGEIALRIRANAGFHVPEDGRPLILIGNGTGLAGLRALLKSRIARGHLRNWLLFGERQQARDFYHRDEIEQWRRQGAVERLDLAWSRDGGQRVYVQDRLREAADVLRTWMEDGAAIYVCGSLAGMAPGVDAALREALGDETVEALREQGRYRRDVY
ncbi:sulfite reductase subunit alpha [Dyella jiangningensis]|uniref:NADPH--hemoprotein reductase n=1 Tax=Dyella jiangningensis TaxID=1379159 RepID=A0A328P2F4_9GAMM|nr:sulfite reductase flavoprotein subunit alpha [Dyella jiangningensis]RAO75461.1 sulfite reductase subunit alpha [Dyella jiangningensis]